MCLRNYSIHVCGLVEDAHFRGRVFFLFLFSVPEKDKTLALFSFCRLWNAVGVETNQNNK